MNNISPTLRLKKCNQEHKEMKASETPKYLMGALKQIGTLTIGARQKLKASPGPIVGISNMLVDEEGFSIGGRQCISVAASCGMRFGATGKF